MSDLKENTTPLSIFEVDCTSYMAILPCVHSRVVKNPLPVTA